MKSVTAHRIIGENFLPGLFLIRGGELDGRIRRRDRLPADAIIDTEGFYSVKVEYISLEKHKGERNGIQSASDAQSG